MSRIKTRFAQLQADSKKALIPFITAGDPHPQVTVGAMHEMVRAGASIIELGVPFSDPMADGPVIQKANERALKHGVSLTMVLNMVSEFRQKDNDTPVVLMGYLNPVEVMGYETFARAASDAGVDGLILVDLPPEEAQEVLPIFKEHELDLIFLLAPTSSEARMALIGRLASGFIYYVSIKGVTGAARAGADEVASKLALIRQHSELPIGIGFGIKDAQTAAEFAAIGDAVVVGSALVNRVEALATTPEQIPAALFEILAAMRSAMDAT